MFKSFVILYFCSFLKFFLNSKNIIISLLSFEMMGLSLFIIMLSFFPIKDLNFFFLIYMCMMVSCSCLGLCLLIVFSSSNTKNLSKSMKKLIC